MRYRSPLTRLGTFGVLALAFIPGPSVAQPPADPVMERLISLIESQSAELEALRGRLEELERKLAAQDAAEPPSSIQWKGGPELASADGAFTAKLRGRVQSDAWATESRTEGVDYPEGMTLRGARLGIEGRLGGAFRYKFEGDYAGDSVTVKDAYVQYVGRPGWLATFGNQKPPFSLEHITGLPRTTFMERALPNVFALPETLGASVSTFGSRWTFALGLFGEPPGVELDADEGHALAGRVTLAPVFDQGRLLHFGISGYRKHMTTASGANFRVRQRPEVRVFGTRLVDTAPNAASTSTAMALEFAGTYGPFALQGEYMRNWVDYRQLEDAAFEGAYLQASWFLTGESRPYDPGRAIPGRVVPRTSIDNGGWGAFEIAARISTLDLNDGMVQGGRENNLTLGLNWYPTSHVRFAFNWVYFDVEGNLATLPFGSPAHEGHAIGARAQVDW
jgi:phosphate-selective porin OprO and OprP